MVALTLTVLNPIFKITKGDIDGLIDDSNFAEFTSSKLREPFVRQGYIKFILRELKPIFQNIDLPETLSEK